MRLKTRTKSRIVLFLEQITALGLKIGVPVMSIALAFLLFQAFGKNIIVAHNSAATNPTYYQQLKQCIDLACQAAQIAGLVVIISLAIRFFYESGFGTYISFVGALVYFGGPIFFGALAKDHGLKGNLLFISIVSCYVSVGGSALVVGLVYMVRDAILRIWQGISIKRLMERRWGDEEERLRKFRKSKIYSMCWDMAYCRDFVRNVCPAAKQKKPCWRLKTGCYCDEKTILLAMSGYSNHEYLDRVMYSLGLKENKTAQISAAQKRARCRRCCIFAEHQRQKYRILSPMVFPAVGLFLYIFYAPVSAWLWNALAGIDKFMNFLTYRAPGTMSTLTDNGHILQIMAIAWISIVLVSYTLRTLEYMIFDLQI